MLSPGDEIRWISPLKNKDYEKRKPRRNTVVGKQRVDYSQGVSLKKEFLESVPYGERNVLLTFSNGLVFRYFEGKAEAWYNGEEVAIEGRYIIDLGKETVKLSYNPQTGKVWYTVVKNDKSAH